MNGADGERDGVDAGEGEDLGEHGGDERVGTVADGNHNRRGRGIKGTRERGGISGVCGACGVCRFMSDRGAGGLFF